MKKVKTRKPRQGLISIYCVDGPLNGKVFVVMPVNLKCTMPLATDTLYQSATYLASTQTTQFGEYVAIFSHCTKR